MKHHPSFVRTKDMDQFYVVTKWANEEDVFVDLVASKDFSRYKSAKLQEFKEEFDHFIRTHQENNIPLTRSGSALIKAYPKISFSSRADSGDMGYIESSVEVECVDLDMNTVIHREVRSLRFNIAIPWTA